MGLKKLFPWLLALVLILATVVGCGTPKLTALELVPQDANTLANIQVGKIVNDKDLKDVYDKAQKKTGQTADEELDKFAKDSGIDLRHIQQIVIFADINKLEQAGYFGFIVEGGVDEKKFIDFIKKESGEELTTSDYKGYRLYTDKKGEVGLSFLGNGVFLFGTTVAAKDIIDVSKGEKKRLSGMVLDAYNNLGDALIKFVFEIPEEARRELAKETVPGNTQISLKAFADMDMFGFATQKEAKTITDLINLHFLNTNSAKDAKDVLSGAISFFKGLSQDPKIKELLGKIEITVAGSLVTITYKTTISEIEQLTGSS